MHYIFEPFDKELSFLQLFGKFMIFYLLGLMVMFGAIFMFPPLYSVPHEPTPIDLSGFSIFSLIIINPIIEESIFRVFPHWLGKKLKKEKVGRYGAFFLTLVWALLHLISKNLPMVFFNLITGIFYLKITYSGKYKYLYTFHMMWNSFIIGINFI